MLCKRSGGGGGGRVGGGGGEGRGGGGGGGRGGGGKRGGRRSRGADIRCRLECECAQSKRCGLGISDLERLAIARERDTNYAEMADVRDGKDRKEELEAAGLLRTRRRCTGAMMTTERARSDLGKMMGLGLDIGVNLLRLPSQIVNHWLTKMDCSN